jgi:hypothetical protein
MYDKNGSFKHKLPNILENPLVFADLHDDVRSALNEHRQEASAAPGTKLEDHGQEASAASRIKRQNAGVWGSSRDPKSQRPSGDLDRLTARFRQTLSAIEGFVGRANPYLVVTGNGSLW